MKWRSSINVSSVGEIIGANDITRK
jgi:hypothetical protein